VVEAESKHNVCFLDPKRRGAGGDPSGVVASFRVQRDPRVNTELGGITKKNVSSEKKSFYTTCARGGTRKIAEFSGGSERISLPQPAFSTNPYPSQPNSMAAAKDL
jgi:hypothetical protein